MSEPAPVDTAIDPESKKLIEEDESADLNTPPQPEIPNDIAKAMKLEKLAITDVGPHVTIDVMPDFRALLLQLVDHSVKTFKQIEQLRLPGLTPATILASCLQSIYSYGAMADAWMIRETSSRYGRNFIDDVQNEQYLTLIGWNLLPPFLKSIMIGLQYTFDPRRKNVAFIYSFAAFSFRHDFGRVFPIGMFITLHNLMAEHMHEETADQIWRRWINTTVVNNRNDNTVVSVGNIIGGGFNGHITDNYLTKKLRTLLNPVMVSAREQQKVLKTFEIEPFNTNSANNNDINPYEYLLSATDENISTMMSFTNEMHLIFQNQFTGSTNLGSQFGTESGTQLMNHYYTSYSLPTFHTSTVSLIDKPVVKTQQNFAAHLKFFPEYKVSSKKIQDVQRAPSSLEITRSLYLHNTNQNYHLTFANRFISFSTNKHVTPEIIVMSPWNTGVSSLYYPITTGLVIESNEIDGFHVPSPNLDLSIHDENSWFLNSAIPLNLCLKASKLNGDYTIQSRARNTDSTDYTKCNHSIFDMSSHRLPAFPSTVADANTNGLLNSFTPIPDVSNAGYASNTIAYKRSSLLKPNDYIKNDIPHHILAWSSYRWIDPKASRKDQYHANVYQLMNFRTLYGTMPTTIKFNHLSKIVK